VRERNPSTLPKPNYDSWMSLGQRRSHCRRSRRGPHRRANSCLQYNPHHASHSRAEGYVRHTNSRKAGLYLSRCSRPQAGQPERAASPGPRVLRQSPELLVLNLLDDGDLSQRNSKAFEISSQEVKDERDPRIPECPFGCRPHGGSEHAVAGTRRAAVNVFVLR